MDYNSLKKEYENDLEKCRKEAKEKVFQEKQEILNYIKNNNGNYTYEGNVFWILEKMYPVTSFSTIKEDILTILEENRKFPIKGIIEFDCDSKHRNQRITWMRVKRGS